MFTGLVQAVGSVASVRDSGDIRTIEIECAEIASELTLGASVAVSGVCLTATRIADCRFVVEVAAETTRCTRLDRLTAESRVNLELPLRASDRLGGHFVQGHVDGVGSIVHAGPRDKDYVLRIQHGGDFQRLVVAKGSVALDGVSLTVTDTGSDWFEVMLIPHTLGATTLGALARGDGVHIEYDILAKYVLRLTEARDNVDETH